MSVEFVKFFIQATESVLESVVGEVPTRGRVELKVPLSLVQHGVSVTIGVIGQLTGSVMYGMDGASARNLCSRMMGGREVTELDELSRSALSELANMISGNAATYLEQAGLTSDITAPSLFIDEAPDVAGMGDQAILVPFNLGTCQLSLVVGVRAALAG